MSRAGKMDATKNARRDGIFYFDEDSQQAPIYPSRSAYMPAFVAWIARSIARSSAHDRLPIVATEAPDDTPHLKQ